LYTLARIVTESYRARTYQDLGPDHSKICAGSFGWSIAAIVV